MILWRVYWRVLGKELHGRAVTAICFAGLTGILEGSALLTLIPVLEGATSAAPSSISRIWLEVIAWLGFSPSMLLPVALAGFSALGISAALLRLCADSLMLRVRTGIEKRARVLMTEALLKIDWSSYLALRQSDISKALIVEGPQIAAGAHSFFGALGSLFTALFYFCCAFAVSVEMTIYTAVFGILLASCYAFASRRVRVHAERLTQLLADLNDKVNDVFGYLKFFRATGSSKSAAQKAVMIFDDFAQTSFKGQIYTPLLRFLFEASALLFVAGFLFWRVYLEGESPAVALVFLAIFYRLAPRLVTLQEGLLQATNYLPWYLSWKERYDYAMQHGTILSGTGLVGGFSELSLTEVQYTYPGKFDPVLKSISLAIRSGECVALVGASGAGKTTLIDLITRLLPPQSGRVTIDGRDLSELDTDGWRNRLGLVMQDSPMFHASILENIAWDVDKPDVSKAIACAKEAHAWEFIGSLPDGLHTIIGERGARLSGGERQRIALARALYREPEVLILDEATSALDGHSEALVQETLESLKGKMTILIIAHRLKSVRMADSIIVLKDGAICEQGHWDELVARDGAFRALWEAQQIGSEKNG